jgi:hypothetical protein
MRGKSKSMKGKTKLGSHPQKGRKEKDQGQVGYIEESFFHEISTNSSGTGKEEDEEQEK